MVKLLIVCHSYELGRAIADFAQKVSDVDHIEVANVGSKGCSRDEMDIDTEEIKDAIVNIYTDSGVLVLMDMGSSVVCAKQAIAELPEYPNIKLCPAPLVEGAIIAVSQIAMGNSLDMVYQEAMLSTQAKLAELHDRGVDIAKHSLADSAVSNVDINMAQSFRFKVNIRNGFHARPAAELAQLLSKSKSVATISNVTKDIAHANAKSVNRIVLSNISEGDEIEITIYGDDANALIGQVRTAFDRGLLLADKDVNRCDVNTISKICGNSGDLLCLAPGVAIGHAIVVNTNNKGVPKRSIIDINAEIEKLNNAVQVVKKRIQGNRDRLLEKGLKDEADIFNAHVMILEDSEMLSEVRRCIKDDKLTAEYVYKKKMSALLEQFRSIDDLYIQERALDIHDIATQMIGVMVGEEGINPEYIDEVIIVSKDVTPSMIGQWELGQLKGIITTTGGLSSHVAILAKALGIPAISGFNIDKQLKSGEHIVFNALELSVVVAPTSEQVGEYRQQYEEWQEQLIADHKDSQGHAYTTDGVEIDVFANVSDLLTAELAVRNGAKGVGLLRTEFMFMNMLSSPSESYQISTLSKVFSLFQDAPIVVRTFDIGGDKELAWLPLAHEENPFLGVRGVRLYHKYKELFTSQLRSILVAANGYNVDIMIPMVTVVEEVEFTRKVLEDVHLELANENIEHKWPVKLGIMVETPSCVLQIDEMAQIVDFFSIGTNDLSQYIMSAERGGTLSKLLNPNQPAILRAIEIVIDSATRHCIPLSVCGEMAADVSAASKLISMGVRKLSMSSTSIGSVKRMIRQMNLGNSIASLADGDRTSANYRAHNS